MDFLYFQVRAVIEGNYKHDRLFRDEPELFESPRARADYVIQRAYEHLLETGSLSISKFEAKSGQYMTWKLQDGMLVEQQ